VKNYDDWMPLKDLNVPLFYNSYTDSITLESLYQTFKTRMEAEGFRAARRSGKKKGKSPKRTP
jgi:hypothetical protein